MLAQLAIFTIYGLIVLSLAFGFLLLCRRRQVKPQEWMPVAPFATAITTMFSLFIAFHASGMWANMSRAERAHTEASMAITRLDEALSPSQLNLPDLRKLLHGYVGYVSKDEWRTARNRTVSLRANAAFRELNGMALAATEKLPSAQGQHILHLLDQLAMARSNKTWLSANHTETPSWLIVFALGVLAHFAIAAAHFDRPRAGLVALAIFASTSTVAYTALGMIDDPYRYLDSLDPSHRLAPD